jgi:segregation and condensation protein B
MSHDDTPGLFEPPAEPGIIEEELEVANAPEELDAAALEGEDEVELEGVDYTPRPGLCDTIEALAFTSSETLTVGKVREIFREEGTDLPAPEVRRAFKALIERWSDPERPLGRGFTLTDAGGGLRFRSEGAQSAFVRRMFAEKKQRLSRAALETLAIIAYRQPLTRPQVDEIRGVDSSGALRALMDRKLVRILGKAEDVGRPLLYGTTKTFLEFFGLPSLRDLPTLKQIQDLDDAAIGPEPITAEEKAVVMDLFDPRRGTLVSSATQAESDDALLALEEALGQASALVGSDGAAKNAKDGAPSAAKKGALLADAESEASRGQSHAKDDSEDKPLDAPLAVSEEEPEDVEP